MNQQELFYETLSELLAIPRADLSPESNLKEIGIDSVLGVEMALRLEDKLGKPLDLDQLATMQTAGEVMEYLQTV